MLAQIFLGSVESPRRTEIISHMIGQWWIVVNLVNLGILRGLPRLHYVISQVIGGSVTG